MFARMFVAAALILGTGAAFASDASYDQQQIREGKVTLVEGGLRLRSSPNATRSEKAAPPAKTDHPIVCSCSR